MQKNWNHGRLQRSPGHLHFTLLSNVNVDFAADPEFRQVNPRLDREQRSRQNQTLLTGLKIVQVRAVAMHFLSQIVPGPMAKLFAVASRLDLAPA